MRRGLSDDSAVAGYYLIVSALTCLKETFARPAVVQPPFNGVKPVTIDSFEPLNSPNVTDPATVCDVGLLVTPFRVTLTVDVALVFHTIVTVPEMFAVLPASEGRAVARDAVLQRRADRSARDAAAGAAGELRRP